MQQTKNRPVKDIVKPLGQHTDSIKSAISLDNDHKLIMEPPNASKR